jgi:hypothetical protein
MVTVTEDSTYRSAHIAPLQIKKYSEATTQQAMEPHTHQELSTETQMTPPATPNGSQEDLDEKMDDGPAVFHAFLRAFYPFQPVNTVTESTVTLPLNEGDVVLVHSIHTNGWADGTLLSTGARGWLPTNYCEAYDPEPMRNLLKGLLNFWDLLKSGSPDSDIFANQEFMRGIIFGIRYLLVSWVGAPHMIIASLLFEKKLNLW